MNWQFQQNYDYTLVLNSAQWAWEFLRRNPDYQADWTWFSSTWQQLETAYGAPPHRDMQCWRADPKAWRSRAEIDGCDDRGCASDGERLAIECWMGARWGFYKFPLNPELRADSPAWDLAWRELETEAVLLDGQTDGTDAEYFGGDSHKVALGFDLARPLGAQFEDARRLLAVLQRQHRKAGLQMQTVENLRDRWRCCLQVWDAGLADASDDDIMQRMHYQPDELAAVKTAARHYVQDGYRVIATMR